MFVISDGEETILYTCDFRSNGRKNFSRMLSNLPKEIDTLICEGTTFVFVLVLFLIFLGFFMLFNGYFMSKYFTKKGCADKAYKAWIPVAYTHQVIVMAGMNPNVLWLYFLVFIPIINIFASLGLTIFIFVAHYRMVKKYDGSDTAAIAITLLIFGGIFFPIYLNFTKEETPESLEIINNIDADQYF